MCQVHTGAYVSLLAPGKTDYTACHPRLPRIYYSYTLLMAFVSHDGIEKRSTVTGHTETAYVWFFSRVRKTKVNMPSSSPPSFMRHLYTTSPSLAADCRAVGAVLYELYHQHHHARQLVSTEYKQFTSPPLCVLHSPPFTEECQKMVPF